MNTFQYFYYIVYVWLLSASDSDVDYLRNFKTPVAPLTSTYDRRGTMVAQIRRFGSQQLFREGHWVVTSLFITYAY